MSDLPLARSGRSAAEIANQAVEEAGEIIKRRFRGEKQVQFKGRGNIVTDVDLEVEKNTMALLKSEYPNHGIISEESTEDKGDSDYTWIIDPVDGTRNYASGIPMFCFAIALVRDEEVLLSNVYDPIKEELFWAQKGMGAFLNGSPIFVSQMETVQSSIIGFDMGYDDERARKALDLIIALWPGMQTIRIMGAAVLGLAYAACGRLDLYFNHSLFPWDLASGILLVTEAGGKITNRDGEPISIHSSGAIASNAAIHSDFMRLTQGQPWK